MVRTGRGAANVMTTTAHGVEILGAAGPRFEEVLTPEALEFVVDLVRTFTGRVDVVLAARKERQRGYDDGTGWGFLPETAGVREGDWKVAPLPQALLDRRVEITGPVERKMVINALNSGANTFMADFEDSNSPTWENT